MSCCVPLCPSRKGKSTVAFHEFPSDIILMEKWLNVIQRKDFVVNDKSATSFVCSLHFKPEDYRSNLKIKRLKKGCIPSIFNSPRSINSSKIGDVQAKKVSYDEDRRYLLQLTTKPIPLTTSVVKTEEMEFDKALRFEKNTLEYETNTLEFETNTLEFLSPVSHLDSRNIVLQTQPLIQNKKELQYELNCQHSREKVLALDKSPKLTPLTTCVNKTKEMEFDTNPLELEANKMEFLTSASCSVSGNNVFETQPLITNKKELQCKLKHQHSWEKYLALKKSLKRLRTSKWEKDRRIQQQQKIVDELRKKLKYYERNKFHTTLEKIIRLEEYAPKANFILQQIENFDKVRPLWNKKTIRECILLRSTSADGYSLIRDRNILSLPSKMTLLRYVEPSDTEIFTKDNQSSMDSFK